MQPIPCASLRNSSTERLTSNGRLIQKVIAIETDDDEQQVMIIRERLVEAGMLVPLLLHMDLSVVSLSTALLVVRILSSLSTVPKNQERMVQQGVVGSLIREFYKGHYLLCFLFLFSAFVSLSPLLNRLC